MLMFRVCLYDFTFFDWPNICLTIPWPCYKKLLVYEVDWWDSRSVLINIDGVKLPIEGIYFTVSHTSEYERTWAFMIFVYFNAIDLFLKYINFVNMDVLSFSFMLIYIHEMFEISCYEYSSIVVKCSNISLVIVKCLT